jgi:hypothetical protein
VDALRLGIPGLYGRQRLGKQQRDRRVVGAEVTTAQDQFLQVADEGRQQVAGCGGDIQERAPTRCPTAAGKQIL